MKPKILMVADVKGWAWWYKAQQVKKHLANEFDIDIVCVVQEGALPKELASKYDLFFTFAPKYLKMLSNIGVPVKKRISGITAHFLGLEDDLLRFQNHVVYFHANSPALVKIAERYYRHVFYVPNGVDETIFYPTNRKPKDVFIVGHVGKPTARKGFDSIIMPAFEKAFSGGRSVATLKVNQRRYYNALSQPEMREWYQDVDVLVFASDLDGTPNPMLEGGAIGIPSIINCIGNAEEFISDGVNGFLMREKTVDAYADRLQWCFYNREQCWKMGEEARKTVLSSWTWKQKVENYRNMFREILSEE